MKWYKRPLKRPNSQLLTALGLLCIAISAAIALSCGFRLAASPEYRASQLMDGNVQLVQLIEKVGFKTKVFFYGLIINNQDHCSLTTNGNVGESTNQHYYVFFSLQSNVSAAKSNREPTLFDIDVNTRGKIITIQKDKYDWEKGNFFVIRLDNGCQLQSEQVAKRNETLIDEVKVLEMFKSNYPDDTQIQKLKIE